MTWRLVTLIALALASANAQIPVEHLNHKDEIGVSGYDPVSYFSGEPKMGDLQWSVEYGGLRYRFANEQNRKAFEASPARYLPTYGGWCAYAMLDGDKVEVDPLSYKIVNGRLLLFYDGFWGDTLKRWNKKLSKTPENTLVEQADRNWKSLLGE